MTLNELLGALYADLGYEDVPATKVTQRLTRYLNEGYRHLMSMPELTPLRLNMLTFVSTPGRKIYGVPQAIMRIDQITDSENSVRLRLMTLDMFRTIDPQETCSGTPTHYIPIGWHPVQLDPDKVPLYITSSSPVDTTQIFSASLLLNFDDVDASNIQIAATLNGTTPVLVYGGIQGVIRYTVNPPTAGTVQMWDGPDPLTAHRLSSLNPADTSSNPSYRTTQYIGVRLWPTPSDAVVYKVDGPIQMDDLVSANNISLIPTDFEYILIDYGRMREYEYRDDSRLQTAMVQYQQKLKYLRDRIMNPPDYRPRVGLIPDRSSNLGSWFPPGRW